jgi:hypothetical protein
MTKVLDESGALIQAARLEGYDGTNWQKLNLLWGFYDTWIDGGFIKDVPAGTYTKDFGAVPSGEVWIANAIMGLNYNTNPSNVRIGVGTVGPGTLFNWVNSPGANTPVMWSGTIALKATQHLYVQISGCALNDDLNISVVGYKMKVSA